jgi:hypothetical protein
MALSDRDDWLEQLGTGAWTGVNELLFGLPEWMAKKKGGDFYNEIQTLREQNPLAAGVGTGLGLVGGMLVPVGGLAKLGGKGLTTAARLAKGADTAVDLTRAGGMAGRLAQAGQTADRAGDILRTMKGAKGAMLRGASQAVPQAAFTADSGGDFLKQAALGTALGGGAELGLGKLLGKAGGAIDDATINAVTGGQARRVRSDVLGGARRATGGGLNKADDKIADLASFLRREGIQSLDDVAEKYSGQADIWKALGNKVDEVGLKPSNILDDMLKDSRAAGILDKFDEAEAKEIISDVITRADRGTNWAGTRSILDDFIARGMKSDDMGKAAKGSLAGLVKELYDDASIKLADDLSGADFTKLKKDWTNIRALGSAAMRDASDPGKVFTGGSDTFMKQAMSQLSPGGAVLGGAMGTGEEGIMDNIAGAAGGALLGSAANKLIPKLGTKALGFGANALSKVTDEGIQQAARGVSRLTSKDVTPDEAETMDKAAPGLGTAIENPSAIPTETATPEAMADAAPKRQLNSKYNMMVIGALRREYYKEKMAEQGVSLQEHILNSFMNTNGFDPKMTANTVWPDGDQAEKFMAQLKARDVLSGLDTDALLGYSNLQASLPSMAQSPQQMAANRQLEAIDAALFDLRKLATGATEDFALKGLSDNVKKSIASKTMSAEEKLQAVRDTFQTYGYSPDLLGSYGV